MSRSPAKNRLEWSEIGALAVLGGLVAFGLAANGLSLVQSAVSLGFGAGVLAIAWLWRLTLRRAKMTPPPTCRQTGLDAALFAAWLAVIGALVWWCYASDRSDHARQVGAPSASSPNVSEDPAEDDMPPEQPHKAGNGP